MVLFAALPSPVVVMLSHSIRHVCSVSLILVLGGCASFGSLTSTTTIEPDKAFRLGGGQPGAFYVRGTNSGTVPIVVFSELDGKRDSVTTIAPGAPVDARFPKSATAIFKNTSSTQTATVSIKVTGDINALGMRYEQNVKQ